MIDIFVQRGAGDRPGIDIIDPLIKAIPVAIERGRNELDEKASGMQEEEVETAFRTGVRWGQLALFHDNLTGQQWRGKIAGIVHRVERNRENGGIETITVLQVKKPTVTA